MLFNLENNLDSVENIVNWLSGSPNDSNVIGGEIIPIESASLILAGAQANALWILPVVFGVIGFAAYNLRRN